MVADAQSPSITRSSAAMVLTTQDKQSLAFYAEEFQLLEPLTENIFLFL